MSYTIIGVGIASAGVAIWNGINQNDNANAQMQLQQNQQQQQLQQAQQNQTDETDENDANQQEKNQENVLSSMGLGKQGWQGTILTSPLGVPSNSPNAGTTGGKTVLGQ